jgi:hypothetical protein
MKTEEAVAVAREWVEQQGSRTLGFVGAHLMGGLATAPRGMPFPWYHDVNLNLVVEDGGDDRQTSDALYKGLLLEYSMVSAAAYRRPGAVLSDLSLASSLRAGGVLSDPTGMLTAVQAAVASEYARRKWVMARTEDQKDRTLHWLQEMARASSAAEAVFCLSNAMLHLSNLLAAASLRPPTHRRSLIQAREILAAQGRQDLYSQVLELLGYAEATSEQAEAALLDCGDALDLAASVHRTPIPFGFKLQPQVRPHIVEGARELIREANHREAMFWILGFLLVANMAIQLDAPPAVRPRFQAVLDRWLESTGWLAPEAVRSRRERAQVLTADLFRVADEIVTVG